jgi:hypothetical protein
VPRELTKQDRKVLELADKYVREQMEARRSSSDPIDWRGFHTETGPVLVALSKAS